MSASRVRVCDLLPGDEVHLPPDASAVFIAQTQHPLWPQLQLVIWRLADGSWSHDALDFHQQVGTRTPSSYADRMARLRTALLGDRNAG